MSAKRALNLILHMDLDATVLRRVSLTNIKSISATNSVLTASVESTSYGIKRLAPVLAISQLSVSLKILGINTTAAVCLKRKSKIYKSKC